MKGVPAEHPSGGGADDVGLVRRSCAGGRGDNEQVEDMKRVVRSDLGGVAASVIVNALLASCARRHRLVAEEANTSTPPWAGWTRRRDCPYVSGPAAHDKSHDQSDGQHAAGDDPPLHDRK
jgi:hypothetical protein